MRQAFAAQREAVRARSYVLITCTAECRNDLAGNAVGEMGIAGVLGDAVKRQDCEIISALSRAGYQHFAPRADCFALRGKGLSLA